MRERRRNTSSTSYTGFRAVEGFQYPSVWKKAGQSVTTLVLLVGAAVLTCALRRLILHGADCSDSCSERTYIEIGAVAGSGLDVLLHVLLLVALKNNWPAATISVVVWNALKAAAAVYLLLHVVYQVHTRGLEVVEFEHLVAVVAVVPVQVVVLFTLSWAAHEQRTADQMDDDDLP